MPDRIFDFPDPHTMQNNSDGSYTASISFMELDPNFIEFPLYVPSLPPQFFAPIGAILVQWGCFESVFDSVLSDFEIFNHGISNNKGLSFGQRKKNFKTEFALIFEKCNIISKKMYYILGDLSDIFITRNLLAHGRLKCRFNYDLKENMKDDSYVSILVNGGKKYNYRDFTFRAEYLKETFYKISHYAGWIDQFRATEFKFDEEFDSIEYNIVISYLNRINQIRSSKGI